MHDHGHAACITSHGRRDGLQVRAQAGADRGRRAAELKDRAEAARERTSKPIAARAASYLAMPKWCCPLKKADPAFYAANAQPRRDYGVVTISLARVVRRTVDGRCR